MKKRSKQRGLKTAMAAALLIFVAMAGLLIGLRLGRGGESAENENRTASGASSAGETVTGSEAAAEAASGAETVTESGAVSGEGESAGTAESGAAAGTNASASGAAAAESGSARSESSGRENHSAALIGLLDAAPYNVGEYASSAGGASVTQVTPTASDKKIVCIDAGHQTHQITEKEPNAPGSDVMKQGVTSGTYGQWSGKNEYEVNLEISLKLRDILVERGYEVVMVREINDVTISNVQRAQIATDAGADIFIRVHCNGVDSSSVTGVLCYGPSNENPYLSEEIIKESQRLCEILRDEQVASTGQKALANLYQDDMTGINWATMPVSIVEVGFMSNPDEDVFISGEEGENLIATGLANGVDRYFAEAE